MHAHYRNLIVMAVVSFIAMYALMYAMVDSLGNVYANIKSPSQNVREGGALRRPDPRFQRFWDGL